MNLTEVVIRENDSVESLLKKVEIATIIGTVQSTFTHFPYLRKIWKQNAEEERLLGVSLTGILDNKLTGLSNKDLPNLLETLKNKSIEVNKKWAEILGIPIAAAIGTIKPSGTVSQLVDSASGIHPRYSPYYIRTVRGDNKDPLTQFMKDQGVPNEPEVFKPDSTTVFSFPMKAPTSAVFRDDLSALKQLELWLIYKSFWCEHNPSITVYVRPDEWLEVGAWVYKNFDDISGVSFLPHSDHSYQQAPYQEISKTEYETLKSVFPDKIDWERLKDYEKEDNTKSSQTLNCTGDYCEVVDIT